MPYERPLINVAGGEQALIESMNTHTAAANPHTGSMPKTANTITVGAENCDYTSLQTAMDSLGVAGKNVLARLKLTPADIAEHDTLTIQCNGETPASTTYEFIDSVLGDMVPKQEPNVAIEYVSAVTSSDITTYIGSTQGTTGTGALLAVKDTTYDTDGVAFLSIAVNPAGDYDSITVTWDSEGIAEHTHIIKRTDSTRKTIAVYDGTFEECVGIPEKVTVVGLGEDSIISDDDALDAAVYLGTDSKLRYMQINGGKNGVYLNPMPGTSDSQQIEHCIINCTQWAVYACANLHGTLVTNFTAIDSEVNSMNPFWFQTPHNNIDVNKCYGNATAAGVHCCAFFDGLKTPDANTYRVRVRNNTFRARRTEGVENGTESYCIRVTGHSYEIVGNTILIDNDAPCENGASPMVVVNGSTAPLPATAQKAVISGNTFQVIHNHATTIPASVTAIAMNAAGTELLSNTLLGQNTWNSNVATKVDLDPAQAAASPKPTVQIVTGAFAGFAGASRDTSANVTVAEI